MAPAGFIWRKFEWEHQGQPYVFEVSSKGGKARFTMPDGRRLELALNVWAALSEAIRKADTQERRAGLPARAGKSWSESEHADMVRSFNEGIAIPEIARKLDRTEGAIIVRLASVGLIDRETLGAPSPPTALPGKTATSSQQAH